MNSAIKNFFIRNHTHGKFAGELFERQISYLFKHYIDSGDHVIDGEASYGRHSKTLSELVGTGGTVYAIEPIPELSKQLEDLRRENIKIFQVALTNKQGEGTFFLIPENSGYSGLKQRDDIPGKHSEVKIKVRLDNIDNLLSDRQVPIKFIKLDLEGGEYYAMKGGTSLLQDDCPVILFENGLEQTASLYGYGEQDFFGLFDEINYRIINCFAEEIDSFSSKSGAQGWQFVGVPAHLNLAQVKGAAIMALVKSYISILFRVSLSDFEKRIGN